MERIREFGIRKIIPFCLLFFIVGPGSTYALAKPKQNERLVLKDITLQRPGLASRVMIMKSSDKTHHYIVNTSPAAFRLITELWPGQIVIMRGGGIMISAETRLEDFTPMWAEGSEDIILGKVEFWDCQLTSDHEYPLVFKMVKDLGSTYLCGRGTVTTKDGKTHRLGYEDSVDTWLPLLNSDDQLDREGAAQALGWLSKTKEEKDKAVPALMEALTDNAMEVRRDVAEALGRIGDSKAIEALNRTAKEDKEEWVREVAEESLGLIEVKEATTKLASGDKTVIDKMAEALKHKWVLVRRTAAESLAKGGAEAVEPLISALKDEDVDVRTNAVKALEEIGDKRAIEPLREALTVEKDEETKKVFEATVKKLEK